MTMEKFKLPQDVIREIGKYYNRAYAPYSKFPVAAAVKFKGHDEYFFGFNIENSAYPSCMCAERVAIYSGIAKLGPQVIESVTIRTNSKTGDTPCGGCLQVISEFADPDTQLSSVNESEVIRSQKFSEVIPMDFDSEFFNKMRKEYFEGIKD